MKRKDQAVEWGCQCQIQDKTESNCSAEVEANDSAMTISSAFEVSPLLLNNQSGLKEKKVLHCG